MSDTSDLEADIFDRWQIARRNGIRFSAAALDQLLSPLTEDRQKEMRGVFSMIEGISHATNATKVQGSHTDVLDALRQRWLLAKSKLESWWGHSLTRWYGKLAVTLLFTPFVSVFWAVVAAYWFTCEVWRRKGGA